MEHEIRLTYVKLYIVLNFCLLTLGQLNLSLSLSGFPIDKPIPTNSSGDCRSTATAESNRGGKKVTGIKMRSESRCALRVIKLNWFRPVSKHLDITSNIFYKCIATFRMQICRMCLRIVLNEFRPV
jgi:hypothetical protein